MRIAALAVGLAISWAAIGGARATEVQFTITGGDSATFELPLNPTPSFLPVLDLEFRISSVPAVVGGVSVTLTDLDFSSTVLGTGGMVAGCLSQNCSFSFSGPQLYTGSEDSPTFALGTYRGLVNAIGGKTDTLTIAEVDPPPLSVPEPSTWAMLLLGFVGLSYAGYKKAKTRAAFASRRG